MTRTAGDGGILTTRKGVETAGATGSLVPVAPQCQIAEEKYLFTPQ